MRSRLLELFFGLRALSDRAWAQSFLGIFFAFSLGILCNETWRPALWVSMAGTGISFCAAVFFRRGFGKACAIGTFFFLGLLYCRACCFLPSSHVYRIFKYKQYRDVCVQGTVKGDVKQSGFHGQRTFYLSVERIGVSPERLSLARGKILVRLFQGVEVSPGDRLEISGKLHRPHDFQMGDRLSYRAFLRKQGIYLVLTSGKRCPVVFLPRKGGVEDFFLMFRERLKRVFDQHLPAFESGLMRAVLLGDRTGVSRQTRVLFTVTGTAHILAISGLHMGMIVLVFLSVLGCLPISLRAKYFLAVILLAAYVPLAGGRVSVLRSAIMASVFLFSFIAERRFCSLNALGLAGFLVLLLQPLDLYSLGFQLSFLAVGSLIVFAQSFYHILKNRLPFFWDHLLQMFCVSFGAWIGVLGMVLYAFGMITPIGLIANLAAVLFMAGIISLGLALVAASLLKWTVLAGMIALDLQILIHWLVHFVALMGRIPYGHFSHLRVSGAGCLLYYGALIFLAVLMKLRQLKRPPEIRRPF